MLRSRLNSSILRINGGLNMHRYSKLRLFTTATKDDVEFERERVKRIVDEAERKEKEKRSNFFKMLSLPVFAGVLATYFHLGYYSELETDPQENVIIAHNKRAWFSIKEAVNFWIYPTKRKLLPDPLPAPYQMKDTLLLELSECLCQPVWTSTDGWRAALRPGLKEFLLAMSSYYEVVIFTTAPGQLGNLLSQVIDQLGCITYRLYREHTKFQNGAYLKDLSILNRDLANVMLLDCNEEAYSLQPENGIFIKPWSGEENDQELFRFSDFFEEVGIMSQIVSGSNRNFDFRSLLKVLREIDSDLPKAWKIHKERLRERLNQAAPEAQPTGIVGNISALFKSLVGKSAFREGETGKSTNLIDHIERIAAIQRKQRASKLPEYERRVAEAKKEHEQQALEPIKEMKKNNAKLLDYLMMSKEGQEKSA